MVWGKSGKLTPIELVLFSHQTPILWHTPSFGKCMGFPSISHSTEKTTKPIVQGEPENWYSYFSHGMDAFSHQIPILWYTSSYGKCMGFPINFPQYRKIQQNPSIQTKSIHGENLGNRYSQISHNIDAIFPLDSHFMVYFITWGMHVFCYQFPITWERQPNPSNGESLGNWCAEIFYKAHCMWRTSEIGTHTQYGCLFSLYSHPMNTSSHGKCTVSVIKFPQH